MKNIWSQIAHFLFAALYKQQLLHEFVKNGRKNLNSALCYFQQNSCTSSKSQPSVHINSDTLRQATI